MNKKRTIATLASMIIGINTIPMCSNSVYADDVIEDVIEQEEDVVIQTETWIQDLLVTTNYKDAYGKLTSTVDSNIENCISYNCTIYKSSKIELTITLSRDIALSYQYAKSTLVEKDNVFMANYQTSYYPSTSMLYIPYYSKFINYGTTEYYAHWNDDEYNLLPVDFVCNNTVSEGFAINSGTIKYIGSFGNDVTNAFFGPNEIKYTFVPTRTLKDTEYEFRLFGHEFTYNPNNSNNNIEPTNEPKTDTNYIDRIKALEEENAKLKEENNNLQRVLASYGNRAYGDMNNDGVTDARDATILLTYYAKTSVGYVGTLDDFIKEQSGGII